jgi:hypothetical protein
MSKTRIALLPLVLCLAVVLVGCAGAGLSWLLPFLVGQAAESSKLVISPSNPTVPPGAKVRFNVKAYSLLGNPVPFTGVEQWSVDANVGTIDSRTGEFTALATIKSVTAGMVSVRVTGLSGSNTASTLVTVDPNITQTIVALSVFPESLTLAQGQQMRFLALPTDASGAAVTDASLLWATGDPTIATIDNTGLLTALPTGATENRTTTVRVIAEKDADELEQTVQVTVKPPTALGEIAALAVSPSNVKLYTGDSLRFVVVGSDANGNFVPVTTARWAATGNIGTISATGVFTAGAIPAIGTVTVTDGSLQPVEAQVTVVAP